MSTINSINNSNLNLVDLPLDTLTLICKHLNMKDACNLYRTGSKNLREAIANTTFDFYEEKYILRSYGSGIIKKFRSVFTNAIGFRVNSYGLIEEDYDYMMPKTCYGEPLKGVRIEFDYGTGMIHNTYKKNYRRDFLKLSGIHTLKLNLTTLVKKLDLMYLDDIKHLDIDGCLEISESVLQYFTKIEYLNMYDCEQMTDNALTYLNSNNLKFLDITWCSITRKAIREFLEKYPNVIIKHHFQTLNE